MKTHGQIEAENCSSEILCPNCGTWLRFPWWHFINYKEARCSYCKSYHKDVNSLKSRGIKE